SEIFEVDGVGADYSGKSRLHLPSCAIDVIAHSPADQSKPIAWGQAFREDLVRVEPGNESPRTELVRDEAKSYPQGSVRTNDKGGDEDECCRYRSDEQGTAHSISSRARPSR